MSILRDAARLRPVDQAWAFALRAGLAVALPTVVLVAAGHSSWAATATFGTFTALYARDEPYRARAVHLAVVAAALVLAVTAGTAAGLTPHPETAGVVAVAIVGGTATLLCARFRVGPPAGLMFAFATAVASVIPAVPADLPRIIGLCAAAAAAAWLIVMAGALVDAGAPRRLAVARALRAAAALAGAPDGPAGLQARYRAAEAIDKAWRAVPPDGDLALLVAHAETELSGVYDHDPAATARLRELADSLSRPSPNPPSPNPLSPNPLSPSRPNLNRTSLSRRSLNPPSPSRFAANPDEAAEVAGRRVAAILLRDRPVPQLRRPLWPQALRVALGALVAGGAAGLLTRATGLGHPYWAAVSAIAVLQAASLQVSLQRAVQRAGGTIVGLLLAGGAVALPGGTWVLVGAVAVAQIAAELLVVRNYGLAMLAITPLALLVGEIGHHTPAATLIGDRLVETVLGCTLGVACAALVRNTAAARHLDEAIESVRAATATLNHNSNISNISDTGQPLGVDQPLGADQPLRSDQPPEEDRRLEQGRRLAVLLTSLREGYEVASGEPGLAPGTTERVLTAERTARRALATLTPAR